MSSTNVAVGRFQRGTNSDLIVIIDDEQRFDEGRVIYAGKIWGRFRGEFFKGDYQTTVDIKKLSEPNLNTLFFTAVDQAQQYREFVYQDEHRIFRLQDEMYELQNASGF